MPFVRFVVLVAVLFAFYNCTNADDASVFCNKELGYLNGELLTRSYGLGYKNELDIYKANDSLVRPVIFFIHGGGWNGGNKEYLLHSKVYEFWASNGYVIVAINYRLAPNPVNLEQKERVNYSQQMQDVAKAFRWVHNNIANYGGNPDLINVIGHSSGAHLALLLATSEKYLEQEHLELRNIRTVCTTDGGPYLTLGKEMFSVDIVNQDPYVKLLLDLWYNAIGSDENEWINATPLFHIEDNKGIPPVLLIHSPLPYRLNPNITLEERFRQANVFVQREEVNIDHSYFIHSIGMGDTFNIGHCMVSFFNKYQKDVTK